MNNRLFRLIALDLDGTLLTDGKIIEEAKVILRNLSGKGIKIVIISGRSYQDIRNILTESSINPEDGYPHILIAWEGEIFQLKGSEYFPLKKWNDWLMPQREKHLPLAVKLMDEWIKKYNLISRYNFKRSIENRGGWISLVFSKIEDAIEVKEFFDREIKAINHSLWLNRNGHGIGLGFSLGKGEVLRKVTEMLKITSKEVLAIGDSQNDEEMLNGKFGFESATTANAEDYIKEVVMENSGYVAKKSYGGGVCEILEKFSLKG